MEWIDLTRIYNEEDLIKLSMLNVSEDILTKAFKMMPQNKKRRDEATRMLCSFLKELNSKETSSEKSEKNVLTLLDQKAKNIKEIKNLILLGADVNARDEEGNTVLIKSIDYFPGTQEIKFLIDNGASINAQNKKGQTPLLKAVQNQRKDVILVLISKGADVKIKDEAGKTALEIAETYKDEEIIKILKSNLFNGQDLIKSISKWSKGTVNYKIKDNQRI